MSHNPGLAINRELANLKARCDQISAAIPLSEVTAAAIRGHPSSTVLDEALSAINLANQRLEILFDRVAKRDGMIGETPLARFYEMTYRPHRQRLDDAYWDLLLWDVFPSDDSRMSKRSNQPIEASTTAYETLAAGVDQQRTYLEVDDEVDWSDPQFDFQACQRLFSLSFFEPDLWLARHREVGPLVLERRAENVPAHVRRRVHEVQNAFVVGNFLAAVALARSMLEYALIERGASLGYEPFELYREKQRAKDLYNLIDAACVARPLLRDAMERVREIGNRFSTRESTKTSHDFPPSWNAMHSRA